MGSDPFNHGLFIRLQPAVNMSADYGVKEQRANGN